jgi:hypothetical protein
MEFSIYFINFFASSNILIAKLLHKNRPKIAPKILIINLTNGLPSISKDL